ncbi:MAG: hypothetical protein PWP73_1044 [Methanococcus sp.]|jgi:hypothetical protein|uniref:Uncharacterized protein n=1 Tax=Methanococcus maripaludis KA1 TaxID=637914 RepID=A0A2Z5PQC5_METMI|nr:hypothetical protein [Methanococcus maripaludis]MDK2929446.1 hypothetical protein [Methanococcus sp.]BAP60607.1 hypothetical protein MMKA1_04900 [Methanococcus maripaludis KA1]
MEFSKDPKCSHCPGRVTPEEKKMIIAALKGKIERIFKEIKSCEWSGDVPEASAMLEIKEEYENLLKRIEGW